MLYDFFVCRIFLQHINGCSITSTVDIRISFFTVCFDEFLLLHLLKCPFLFHFLVIVVIMLVVHNSIVALFCNSAPFVVPKFDRLPALDFES
jgi:hypothetical protein